MDKLPSYEIPGDSKYATVYERTKKWKEDYSKYGPWQLFYYNGFRCELMKDSLYGDRWDGKIYINSDIYDTRHSREDKKIVWAKRKELYLHMY